MTQESAGPGHPIYLDFPVDAPPRYGWGRPPHPRLYQIIDRGRELYRRRLASILRYEAELCRIPRARGTAAPQTPCWTNGMLPGLDAAALYAFVRELRPARYFEVGAGQSTRFVRRAIEDGSLPTRIVAVDPYVAPEVEAVCDRFVRQRLEDVDLSLFDELEAGDILFVDNSHRVFMNSDATVTFLDVLPRLAGGVWVQFHDIGLPVDYPPEWIQRYYSEQYLLAAYLLGGERLKVVLPNAFVSLDEDLRGVLAPLWSKPALQGVETFGSSFWVEIA